MKREGKKGEWRTGENYDMREREQEEEGIENKLGG